MKKIAVFLLLTALFLPANGYAQGPAQKFGRGVTNILTGAGEFAVQYELLHEKTDFLTSVFGGLVNGLVYTIARELVGVYDVVTFPIPLPAKYEPVYRPETVFEAFRETQGVRP